MTERPSLTTAIDTHTHLNHPRLLRRLDQVLARAREAGVSQMVVVGYDLPSSETAVALARQHPCLYASVGVHPHDAGGVSDGTLARLRELARGERVVAIGETGLDFYRDLAPREAQTESFRRHLGLAAELGLPAIVHCREAQEALLEILTARKSELPSLIWHCFDGTREQAETALALGAFLGFGGTLTYPRGEEMREVAAAAPEGRILVETDCPYLSPEPTRGRDNEPANLTLIIDRLAAIRRAERATMATATAENARRVFSLIEESHG